MSPQKSLQFFQPMVHVPLNKVDSIFSLPGKAEDYLVYTKPKGIDVYMVGGKIYDFNHRELKNRTLAFTFERVLQITMQSQGLYIGTLVTLIDSNKIIKHSASLYEESNEFPVSIRFVVYDIIFPYFKVDNPLYIRNDIAEKTIGQIPHCSALKMQKFENLKLIKHYIKEKFNIERHASFIIFAKNGQYHSGTRQLTYGLHDQVSFEISASQKYRAHIKKILPVDIELSEGKIITIAGSIEARFKNEEVDIPITMPNYIMRRNLWEHRKELKRMPFIFEGLYFEEDGEFEILGKHYSKLIL